MKFFMALFILAFSMMASADVNLLCKVENPCKYKDQFGINSCVRKHPKLGGI